MTRLHLLHTCHGQPHRAALDYAVAPIGGNQVRLTATRCARCGRDHGSTPCPEWGRP